MRILVVSAMFPPNVLGGAEISAFNLASWLLKQNNEIGVLMAAKSPEEEKFGEIVDGMKIWSIYMPRPYPIFAQGAVQQKYLKPIWHLQDHLDPRNRTKVSKVIDEFRPDFCNVHYLTGIGHNVLSELGKRDIPVMYVMPDLALSCVRLTMFRDGKTCERQCWPCKISAASKRNDFRSVRRIGFCAPSRANLERNARFQALDGYPTAHILNANKYPTPTVARNPSATVRFIYVGRLHAAKGVDLLIQAAEMMSQDLDFSLTIVGGGAEEEILRQKYGHHPRIEFTGHVPLQQAINRIAESDVLCIPSIWLENSPGVVIQALGMGVPVIGSEVGGIPELVQHDETGLLVAPGDVTAWSDAMQELVMDRARLGRFQQNAAKRANEFDQDFIGRRYVAFMDRIMNFEGLPVH
jgi:glycosyltransferase involved in cell wall biosynthesis